MRRLCSAPPAPAASRQPIHGARKNRREEDKEQRGDAPHGQSPSVSKAPHGFMGASMSADLDRRQKPRTEQAAPLSFAW
jgi:hypothetical protein